MRFGRRYHIDKELSLLPDPGWRYDPAWFPGYPHAKATTFTSFKVNDIISRAIASSKGQLKQGLERLHLTQHDGDQQADCLAEMTKILEDKGVISSWIMSNFNFISNPHAIDGVILSITMPMAYYSCREPVQEHGCTALCEMIKQILSIFQFQSSILSQQGEGLFFPTHLLNRIDELGGLRAILATIDRLPGEEQLQFRCLEVLRLLLEEERSGRMVAESDNYYCDLLLKSNAMGLTLKVMRLHEKSYSIQKVACCLLTLLGNDEDETHASFFDWEQTASDLVNILQIHSSCDAIVLIILAVLRWFMSRDPGLLRLLPSETILQLASQHEGKSLILQACFRILSLKYANKPPEESQLQVTLATASRCIDDRGAQRWCIKTINEAFRSTKANAYESPSDLARKAFYLCVRVVTCPVGDFCLAVASDTQMILAYRWDCGHLLGMIGKNAEHVFTLARAISLENMHAHFMLERILKLLAVLAAAYEDTRDFLWDAQVIPRVLGIMEVNPSSEILHQWGCEIIHVLINHIQFHRAVDALKLDEVTAFTPARILGTAVAKFPCNKTIRHSGVPAAFFFKRLLDKAKRAEESSKFCDID